MQMQLSSDTNTGTGYKSYLATKRVFKAKFFVYLRDKNNTDLGAHTLRKFLLNQKKII